MSDSSDYPSDPGLDARLERVLARKAERAAAAAPPLAVLLARPGTGRTFARRRLALLATVGVLVAASAAGLGLGWLRSNTPVGAQGSPSPPLADIAALRRPIAVPSIGPGGPCPASPVGLTLADLGAFQGTGAVRVNNLDDVALKALPVIDGWSEEKVFWAVDARESGPILVRAVRLDGSGGIGLGADFGSELLLGNDSPSSGGAVVGPSPAYPIERVFVDSVSFHQAGCYLLQMDWPATTSVVVFRALAAPLLSATAAAAAAIANAGSGVSVVSTTLSTYGAEARDGLIAAPGTIVWAVRLSGSFAFSCGPYTATPHPCPPPATTELILIDAETGAFIEGMQPAPEPTVTGPPASPAH